MRRALPRNVILRNQAGSLDALSIFPDIFQHCHPSTREALAHSTQGSLMSSHDSVLEGSSHHILVRPDVAGHSLSL